MAIEGIYLNNSDLSTKTAIGGKGTQDLGMEDFMNLLVAQMTNQDMMNPVNDTEFIAQMAQFSSLQGIQTIQEYQLSAYASSYAGKYVAIAEENPLGGIDTISGKVEAVTFYDGTPKVQVNGKLYDLHKVMEVSDSESAGSLGEASSYIGKKVTVTWKDEYKDEHTETGLVTGITIKDNKVHIILDGKEEYPLTAIKTVHESDTTEDSEDDKDTETEAEAKTFNNMVASEIAPMRIPTSEDYAKEYVKAAVGGSLDSNTDAQTFYNQISGELLPTEVPTSGIIEATVVNKTENDGYVDAGTINRTDSSFTSTTVLNASTGAVTKLGTGERLDEINAKLAENGVTRVSRVKFTAKDGKVGDLDKGDAILDRLLLGTASNDPKDYSEVDLLNFSTYLASIRKKDGPSARTPEEMVKHIKSTGKML